MGHRTFLYLKGVRICEYHLGSTEKRFSFVFGCIGPLRAVHIFVIRYYVNGPIRSPTLLRNAHYIRQGKKLHRSVSNSV